MDKNLRDMQLKVLSSLKKYHGKFSLAGATALDLFYLNHRFSKDLDFFSPHYEMKEERTIVNVLAGDFNQTIKPQYEFSPDKMTDLIFCELLNPESGARLRINFQEDVIIPKPEIKNFKGVPVYSAENIYTHTICLITAKNNQASAPETKNIILQDSAKDIIDLYYLSKKIKPLTEFLKNMTVNRQRAMVNWFQNFSQYQFNLDFLNLKIYDTRLESTSIITHLEEEMNKFMLKAVL